MITGRPKNGKSEPWPDSLPFLARQCRRSLRAPGGGSRVLHLRLLIRAMARSLAIPEHEVYQQARRSEREAGLAFFVAHWSPHSDPPFTLLDPRLHMITALEASAERDF
jgi:hypothetical protein